MFYSFDERHANRDSKGPQPDGGKAVSQHVKVDYRAINPDNSFVVGLSATFGPVDRTRSLALRSVPKTSKRNWVVNLLDPLEFLEDLEQLRQVPQGWAVAEDEEDVLATIRLSDEASWLLDEKEMPEGVWSEDWELSEDELVEAKRRLFPSPLVNLATKIASVPIVSEVSKPKHKKKVRFAAGFGDEKGKFGVKASIRYIVPHKQAGYYARLSENVAQNYIDQAAEESREDEMSLEELCVEIQNLDPLERAVWYESKVGTRDGLFTCHHPKDGRRIGYPDIFFNVDARVEAYNKLTAAERTITDVEEASADFMVAVIAAFPSIESE